MKQIIVYWPFKGKGLLAGKPLFRLAIINFRQNDLMKIARKSPDYNPGMDRA